MKITPEEREAMLEFAASIAGMQFNGLHDNEIRLARGYLREAITTDNLRHQLGRLKAKVTRAEELAERFHEAYERLAPQFGYETRPESATAWRNVPDRNKRLMVAVCREMLAIMPQAAEVAALEKERRQELEIEVSRLRAKLPEASPEECQA